MNLSRRLFAALALAACAALSLPAHATDKASRAGIEAGAKALMDAVKAKDADAIAATYTDDAQMLPANGDIVRGKAAIRKLWQEWIDDGLTGLLLEPNEIEAAGALGYDVSMYKLYGKDNEVTDHGKSLVVWHRVKGKWKLHRDMWTTSMPAP